MSYLVIAYPELAQSDFHLIQEFRKSNDWLYYSVVQPHFTLVFPVVGVELEFFVREIRKIAEGIKNIEFVLRCATVNKDAFSDYYHTFLVPDEGNSQLIKLHDKLYSKNLATFLRLDIDFIPHMAIGNSLDKYTCKKMVDQWNARDFEIKGAITSLSIVKYEHKTIEHIEQLKFNN